MGAVSSAAVIAVEWALLGICLALVLARLHLRLRIQLKRPILSDYCICLAWLCGIWGAVLDIELKKLRWLSPATTWIDFLSNTPNPDLTIKVMLLHNPECNGASNLNRSHSLHGSHFLTFLYLLWTVAIFSILSFITSILLVLLMCLPQTSSDHGLCSAKNSFIIWTSTWALHFSSDIFIFCLPFFVLRIIRLAWKRKIALYVTFGFGIFSIGACIGRFLTVVITYPDVPTTTLELWCALDVFTGLIVACLPSLRPYLTLNTGPSHLSKQTKYTLPDYSPFQSKRHQERSRNNLALDS
ncbi:hypothetical protein BDV41DRAFT_591039 [Aspergillus transmontanensis]|uniref:Rhodopsin domain-containing protein n=1 Tax=Aspergillus transmontanensis TaxID=1034304 RepID=A0A5N6WCT6_9EURO|nr:hypothetical protein BDV41DRAFT_591039 [Aspergillus transmontanensis]